jgi:cation diffusion facilitator CzcD-associated flavoprotein CzcO
MYAVDVIIAATGYDTSYVPAFQMTGRNGVNLGKRWAETGAEAYFTCAVPDMPNYFSESSVFRCYAMNSLSNICL